ncbi:membrane-spanning 4-domains subfamily A member 4A-like [Carassius auratus]|uniref:Membrane-spanning 4-domains subfamily A member 4A-like n=1 Tax=Carassius auratus TaxID=7957 RepID=A0A6P6KBK9_CARAU|nr:membrane-spanning 4-domains subfamily A member 4A-like [Carassius auratus]
MSMTAAVNNVNQLEKFLKSQPKALGAVQIMIGVFTMLLGIIEGFSGSFAVDTGIKYWGSIIFIVSGSLTIAAENKLHPCMVKASLGVNVVSAITSGIAILVFATGISYALYGNAYKYSSCVYYLLPYRLGISGILLALSFLQFIISICLSSFACKATCFCVPQGVNLSLNQQFYSLPVPLTNQSITVDYINMSTTSVVNGHRERDLPPIPRDTTDQTNDNEYEQPTYNQRPDML